MTIKSLWKQLKDLVECDKKISNIQQEIVREQKNIAQDNATLLSHQKNYDAAKATLLGKQKLVHEQELAITTLKETEQRKCMQLETVKNNKEYKILEKEINSCNVQCNALEERLIQLWHEIDTSKTMVEAAKKQLDSQADHIQQAIAHKKDTIAQLETIITQAQQDRINYCKAVPTEWMARYDRMRHNVSDPIIKVTNNSCGSCYYAIPFQDLSKLKKSALVVCRNCYRFLYYDEDNQLTTPPIASQ